VLLDASVIMMLLNTNSITFIVQYSSDKRRTDVANTINMLKLGTKRLCKSNQLT